MEELINILHTGNHSLVVGGEAIHTYDGRGVSDLFRLSHDSPSPLRGSLIADKVVGKGAAALMAWAGVGKVYADVISRPALDLLQDNAIPTTYTKLVPHIINHAGTGMCPLETRCIACRTVEECLEQIRLFMEEMQKQH